MQFGQYKKSFSSLQLENNFFRILTLGLLTLVLILVVALLNKKGSSRKSVERGLDF
jgi:hypothetical protein